jgi:LAS superfamily LD-carboxypeptidase LdcB
MKNELDIITGTTQRHLVDLNAAADDRPTMLVHQEVVGPLRELQQCAADAGFDLQLCSGFRSFERQRLIWNSKLSGLRPVVDDKGMELDLAALSPWQQVQAVLRWSALPGASRHHWGTDMDIYDAAAMPEGYQIQLVPEEVEGSGIFAPMHDWLDAQLARRNFYRPYANDTGGIAPERWHISYRPIAENYARSLTADALAQCLRQSDILLVDVVLEHLDEIIRRYLNVA